MADHHITEQDVLNYYKKVGKGRGSMLMTSLAKSQQYMTVLNSEIGREILTHDIERAEELLIKCYRKEVTDNELAEVRYLMDYRFPAITARVKSYLEKIGQIKGENAQEVS